MEVQHADSTFEELWEDMADELARLIGALGVPRHAVGDVLHDVYLAGHKGQPQDLPPDQFRRWLYRVTVNRCHLEHRRAARWRRVWAKMLDSAHRPEYPQSDRQTAPGERLEREEERRLVRDALDRLEPPLRSVLVLRYYAGMNSREIGAVLGMPDSTVRSHLRTARKRLARELERTGYLHE